MLLGTEQQRKDKVEKVIGESLGELLCVPRKIVYRKGLNLGGAAFTHLEVRKGGPGDRIWGLVRVLLPLAAGPLGIQNIQRKQKFHA